MVCSNRQGGRLRLSERHGAQPGEPPMSVLSIHRTAFHSCCLAACIVLASSLCVQGEEKTVPNIVTVFPEHCALSGIYEGRQLIVTADSFDQRPRDLTGEARYRV